MFNQHPTIREQPLLDGHHALIIDDALSSPDQWVDWACQAAAQGLFGHGARNAYPGLELPMPAQVCDALQSLFDRHVRNRLGARRTVSLYSRLALVTSSPHDLQPRQWLCHRDRLDLPPEQCAIASVLYLFKDPQLGGTNFFRPRQPIAAIERLVHASGECTPTEFAMQSGLSAGYMNESNHWFERVGQIEPRFNRLVFYSGNLFHCSHIPRPEMLSADPAAGRLTLNGFFSCQRRSN